MIIPLHIILTLFSMIVLLLAIYMRESKRSMYIVYSFLAIFLFNLGFFIEISANVMEVSIIGKQIKYLGLPLTSPFMLLFILEHYNYSNVTKIKKLALFFVPILHMLAALTFPYTKLFYTSVAWVADSPIPHLETGKAIMYYIGFFYANILMLSILVIAIIRKHSHNETIKRQSGYIIASATIPGVGNAISVLMPHFFPFDPTALLLTISCSLLAYLFIRRDLFSIAPIAREQIIENIRDAFILVDNSMCFIDANTAAIKLFPQLSQAIPGTPLYEIHTIPWPGGELNFDNWTFDRKDEMGEIRHYTISKTPISHKGEIICDCLMIYDITELKTLLDRVSKLAERDSLTGVINRRTFFDKGEWMFDAIVSSGGKMSALMIDVDLFKTLNDTYGHQVGDNVLVTIAESLANRFRSTDLFARYGGEEFCALLPRTDINSAMHLAEKLREIVENIDWGADLPNMQVTISIGVADYDKEKHLTLESLIGSADIALYNAKHSGRNAVRSYSVA